MGKAVDGRRRSNLATYTTCPTSHSWPPMNDRSLILWPRGTHPATPSKQSEAISGQINSVKSQAT